MRIILTIRIIMMPVHSCRRHRAAKLLKHANVRIEQNSLDVRDLRHVSNSKDERAVLRRRLAELRAAVRDPDRVAQFEAVPSRQLDVCGVGEEVDAEGRLFVVVLGVLEKLRVGEFVEASDERRELAPEPGLDADKQQVVKPLDAPRSEDAAHFGSVVPLLLVREEVLANFARSHLAAAMICLGCFSLLLLKKIVILAVDPTIVIDVIAIFVVTIVV